MKKNRKRPLPISDEEEASIQRGIAEDPDNPEWTEEDFKNAQPFADVARFDWEGAIVKPGRASATGRARFAATGFLGADLVTVVFSPLGSEAISIVSFRSALRAIMDERSTGEALKQG